MSPEQAFGSKELDYRTDIWSLGVIAFECLTGRRPFEAQTVGKLLVAICTEPLPVPSALAVVPAGFDAWFARACARNVMERFQSAREAMAELRRVCEWAPSTPVSSIPSSNAPARSEARAASSQHPYSLTPSVARRRSRRAVPLVVLLLAVAGGVALVVLRREAASDARSRPDASPPHGIAAPAPLPSVLPEAPAPLAVPAPPRVSPSAAPGPALAPSSRPRLPRVSPPRAAPPAPRPKPSDAEDLGI
jgi:serine/threonine-protein kinase